MRSNFFWSGMVLLLAAFPIQGQPAGSGSRTDKVLMAQNTPSCIQEPNGVLTLAETLAWVLRQSPELAAFSWDMRISEAEALQAGLLPNPEAEVVMEQLGGSGSYRKFRAAQTTLQLSQLIELGRKRQQRQAVAGFRTDMANWEYQSRRLDVLTATARAFVEVLGLQERVALAGELAAQAHQVDQVIAERVKAGAASPLEALRSGMAVVAMKLQQQTAERELHVARIRLASCWGSKAPVFAGVQGDFYQLPPVEKLDASASAGEGNPDIRRWDAELKERQAVLEAENAQRIPDLTVTGGMQHFNEDGDTALVVGLSVPLPLFNRNQGNIQAARARLMKGYKEQQTTILKAQVDLEAAWQTLALAHQEAFQLETILLPGTQAAWDAAREGYRLGKFGYLEVLDSQRQWFETKGQYIAALTAFHKARADVERLQGGAWDVVPDDSGRTQKGVQQ